MRKIILPFLFALSVQVAPAQKKVVLEMIRCFSTNLPVAHYLEDTAIQKSILSGLNQTLIKYQGLSLVDTTRLNVQLVTRTLQPDYKDADTSRLHLYLDFIELDPSYFFRNPDNPRVDSVVEKRAGAVFLFSAWLLNAAKNVVYTENLNIVVSTAETPGMGTLYGDGIRFNDLAVLPKVFTEFLRAGANILLDPKNELALVEIKLQPAYLADNYIFPKTVGKPRIYVTTNKNISSYHLGNTTEMMRMDEPVYEQIMLKGKKAQKYPDDITNAIKNTDHFPNSDYVFLRQESRDVIRDKNYLLKLTVQVDPENPPVDERFLFTNFLAGNFHYLLTDKDTLAKFTIRKDVGGTDELYINTIGNGYDTLSFYRIKTNLGPMWRVRYGYVVDGIIGGRSFSIKCSGIVNTVKEIYVDKKLVCIAQGKFTIEKFVVFDASLSPELLNQLFMIGFNHFFE